LNVFVTGATGFFGFHIARLLTEKSLQVKALVRPASDAAPLIRFSIEPVTAVGMAKKICLSAASMRSAN
jgi:thioester reductase-like protein